VSFSELRSEMWALSLFGGRLAAAELILFSVFLTDIVMLGYMSELSLSAALLANSTFVLFYVTALGFLQGALPLATRHLERGDRSAYSGVILLSILQAAVIGLVIVATFIAYPPILRALGYPEDMIAESWAYIAWILPSYGLSVIYIALRNAVIATSSSQGFITLSLATLVLNAIFNYLLGFGFSIGDLTFTGMGISGIGLASSIIEVVLFTGFLALLQKSGFRLSDLGANNWQRIKAALQQIRESLVIGLPIGVVFFVNSTLFSGVLIMVGRHDIQGMAALALIFECAALLLMMPFGLSEAIVQRVSLFDALNRAARQRQIEIVTQASICVTFAYILLLAVIYFAAGINIPVLLLFDKSSHQDLIATLDALMILGFLVAALHTFVIIMASILRGLLDVNISMFVSLTCYWGVGLGLTFILVEIAGHGARFGLISVVIALAVSVVSITWRLWLLRSQPQST